MRNIVSVAALQAHYSDDIEANLVKTEKLIREAAQKGGQIILASELFHSLYFCTTQDPRWFGLAHPLKDHPTLGRFQNLARALNVVLPISFFERDGQHYYNSVAILDADGAILGVYRKSHIPDGPGYSEKYYFRPGNSGYKVWQTKFATIGVGICWDQWFPECSRAMALLGADILFYPTAIGSEPHDPSCDSAPRWQMVQQGQSIANVTPWVAANRVGEETGLGLPQTYYGSSFITDHEGQILKQLNRQEEGVIVAAIDLDRLKVGRTEWPFFRDRRADLLS